MPEDKEKEFFDKLHKGRFSGSNLGCPRAQALRILGYEPVITKAMQNKFDEGREHDEEMKLEAMEEFDDYYLPGSVVIKLTRGKTAAYISLTPDGLREKEVVEFKGLAASFWNSLRSEEDFKEGTSLTQKYYRQVQAYAGAFKKPTIRFRLKNKKNLKTKDIVFDADPKIWAQIKNDVLDIQEILDRGELPPKKCSKREEKFCFYKKDCLNLLAEDINSVEETELDETEVNELTELVEIYVDIRNQIEELEKIQKETHNNIQEVMRSHGQRELDLESATIKYGVRYKSFKNKEDVEKLIQAGKIRVEDKPEEYCAVYPKQQEKEEGE